MIDDEGVSLLDHMKQATGKPGYYTCELYKHITMCNRQPAVDPTGPSGTAFPQVKLLADVKFMHIAPSSALSEVGWLKSDGSWA